MSINNDPSMLYLQQIVITWESAMITAFLQKPVQSRYFWYFFLSFHVHVL